MSFGITLQSRQNFVLGDRMLPDPNSTCIVDCIRYRSWRGADGRLGKAFRPKEPPRFEAIHEYLCLFGHIHDGREPVRQLAHAEVTGTWKLTVPGNGFGRDLSALYQRSIHIGFGQQRVDDVSGVMAIGRSDEPPIPG